MKKLFNHYYTCDFDKIISESKYLVIDTNILLDFFRLRKDTIEQLLSILDNFKDKLWIPYHVACEYHQRHNEVISKQSIVYSQRSKSCSEQLKIIKRDNEDNTAHPYLDTNQYKKVFTRLQQVAEIYADLSRKVFEDGYKRYNDIAEIFTNKVNTNDIDDLIKAAPEEAIQRKEKNCPLNVEKKDTNQYGDLIIWMEMLKYCASEGNTVFLTNDKEWFLEIDGKTICPHPSLRKEYFDVRGHNFYAYRLKQFIKNFQSSDLAATWQPSPLDIDQLLKDLEQLVIDDINTEIEYSETTNNLSIESSETPIPCSTSFNTGFNSDNQSLKSCEKGSPMPDNMSDQSDLVDN